MSMAIQNSLDLTGSIHSNTPLHLLSKDKEKSQVAVEAAAALSC